MEIIDKMVNILKKIEHFRKHNRRGQQQVSTWTAQDRYPSLFYRLASMYSVQSDLRILSFGCSSGEELQALDDIYFRSATIHGVDIDQQAIAAAQKKVFCNNAVLVFDYNTFQNNEETYDLILAMSVLCRWPETKNKTSIEKIYPFEQFSNLISLLDDKLKPGGHLVIFNSNYRLEDTQIFRTKYEVVAISHDEEEFVHKFYPLGPRIVSEESGVLFRKISNETHKAPPVGSA